MITVRIPEEIRKYKAKRIFGLTTRQLVCLAIAVLVCLPLWFFGKNYFSEDVIGWAIIIIAIPCGAIGFIAPYGIPMEKFFVSWMKSNVLFPKKRRFHTDNVFRELQNKAKAEKIPTKSREKKKYFKEQKEAALEKTFLLAEAEANGTATYTSDPNAEKAATYDVEEQKLLTVRTKKKGGGTGNGKKDDDKKKKEKNMKKTALQIQAEEIEERRKSDPQYVPTKKEFQTLSRWYAQQEKMRKQEINKGKKEISKKSTEMKKRRSAKMAIPRSTQNSIPYLADYEEGLFEVTENKYSKMYRMKDINYRTGKDEEQVAIFCKWTEFLNYFSEDMRFAFIVDNRVVSLTEQERKVFKQMKGDIYDKHRKEYNKILRRQIVAGRNDIQVQLYLTVTIDANNPIEALLRFHKIDAEVIANLRKIGSDGEVLTTDERLEYYHDKFRKGHEGEFHIDYNFIKAQGIHSKDYIAPSLMQFDPKHFQIEDGYYRCLFLNNLPASLSDVFFYNLCDNNFPVTTSVSIDPVSKDVGFKLVRKQLSAIEDNKMEAERKAVRGGYSPETIQHSIKDAHAQAEVLYDDILNKNQKLFFVTITLMVYGSTLEELDANCKTLMGKARTQTAQLQCLTSQQEEAFKVTLPFGYSPKNLCVERALTTESTAIFMPFSSQELFQPGGFYYGLNQISRNLVIVNRTKMKTPSGFVLGSSGSGKSFATKREMLNVLLDDDKTAVLVIDPENEYGDFCRAFGGTVVKISADSDNHINPMDMPKEYGLDEDDDDSTPIETMKDKAIKKKSDYILSIVERMISVGGNGDDTSITPQQKTIVDRAVRETYREYLAHDFDPAYQPTLLDLQVQLDNEGMRSVEGKQVADGVEYYTRGSMDIFAHETNVDISNRFVVFNVRDLGSQLQQIALIIVFDFIWSRMIKNKNSGVRTYCYCDEIHVMFQSYYSANFLKQLYKRGRKYGLCITGITQNVEDLLRSEQAKGMISNSDFIMMLNQSSEDLKILAGMLNISPEQMGYVTGADAGCGLLFAEKVIVPFVDRFPVDSYLYKLMSTKFGEEMSKSEIEKTIAEIMKGSQTDLDEAG